jgi:hypothetical protein
MQTHQTIPSDIAIICSFVFAIAFVALFMGVLGILSQRGFPEIDGRSYYAFLGNVGSLMLGVGNLVGAAALLAGKRWGWWALLAATSAGIAEMLAFLSLSFPFSLFFIFPLAVLAAVELCLCRQSTRKYVRNSSKKSPAKKVIVAGLWVAGIVVAAAVIYPVSIVVAASPYRAINVDSIKVSNAHIWLSPNGTSSVAGFVVQNTGGKVVSIQTITVRGQSVPTDSWWYNSTSTVATATNIQTELKYDGTLSTIDVSASTGGEERFTKATGPIPLQQGQAMFVYMVNPAGITAVDSGLAFTMNVQAGKASAVTSVSVVNG